MARERGVRNPISKAELERRWKLIRAAMAKKGIDSLVVQNDNKWLGGYLRYFCDIPGEHNYPKTVLFPLNEEMTMINSGGEPLPPSPPDWAIRGVKQRFGRPYFRTLNYTNEMDASIITQAIKSRGDKRVGVVGFGMMDAFFYTYLNQNLPGVEIIDFTDDIDYIKAIKSQEEMDLIRKACQCQDIICAAMPTIIRPGKYEYQLRGEIFDILLELGGEEALIMIGSASPGAQTGQFHPYYQNRQIKQGDQVLIMLEMNGPGGYWGEIARTWSLGEPPADLVKAFAAAKEAQRFAAGLLQPGVIPQTVVDAVNDFMVAKGYLADKRLMIHGQGYDLVERPGFQPGETMPLQTNMCLAVHPIALTPDFKTYAFCCDDYLLTENGAELLHKTPQEIITIPCFD
ncbi:MAG: M24 family metallopeptidase [Gracilibacteraceae bacterium]|jgi:Xaa-Pro aminopeptidase|nr:M24 family metallopeptidase [Gracilibacteraceae bacterium]